ncbi:E3 ubiquitin-protein ligase RNF34 isoform X2 [Bombyx mandarina]|uniref:E3 ubiquitin-protein ligase RNF34 isoform X2 n=1 Tax=Bombyx mandarina TaxID=7092 RepID=A0A6J2KF10_BOMMA|nr:E3 ubiquitin-protein ligase RNF34 isoform X2 [Bombyx mandarina]
MPCESCAVQFSVFRHKRVCGECERYYCSRCLRRGGGSMCAPCRVLSTRPLSRANIAHLKVRDLQCFLHRQNVSTRGCVEKEELVGLCVTHVNSTAYRRRSSRNENSPFSSLKGLTVNINEFISSTFNLRPASQPYPAPPPPTRSCHNNSHSHVPGQPASDRLTTSGGEADIRVPIPQWTPEGERTPSRSPSVPLDTADCFEIEDLDDQGWELITRPADPLPNDSEILLSATDNPPPREEREERRETEPEREAEPPAASPEPATLSPGLGSHNRAASELELRPSAPHPDTGSLQDEPLPATNHGSAESAADVALEALGSEAALEALSVRQLKRLLLRHRVEYRGAIERADLLERARTLWRDQRAHAADPELLPLEDACKICMAARLECVLLECGHIATCTQCSSRLAECPICRRFVVRAVRFFRS